MPIRFRLAWVTGAVFAATVFGVEAGAADESVGSAPVVGLEEVVVTARKFAENVQDTPTTMTASTGVDLENRSVAKFDDLVSQVPGLVLTPSILASGGTFLFMRGQGQTSFRLTLDTAIGVYVDDIYYPGGYGTNSNDLWDIDRLEVLKGPQGTLYGRSDDGGALKIYTNAPTNEEEGSVRLRFGNDNQAGVAFMLNAPLSNTLSFRIAGEVDKYGPLGHDTLNGADLGSSKGGQVRTALKWTPTDALSITARLDYGGGNVVSLPQKGGIAYPVGAPVPSGGTAGAAAPFEIATELGLTGPNALSTANAIFNSYGNGSKDNGSLDVPPFDKSNNYGGSLTADYKLLDNLQLRSITGYREYQAHAASDLDGSPFSIFSYPNSTTAFHQFSQEFQLLGSAFGHLRYVTGVFYSDEEGHERIEQQALALINPSGTQVQEGDVTNRTVGVYAQGTYAITDRLNFTLGGRYSSDYRGLVSENHNALSCVALGTPYDTTSNCAYPISKTFAKPTYTVGFDYHPAEHVMVYIRQDEGYRSGALNFTAGSNVSPAAARASYIPVNPEIVINDEVGLKTDFLDRRLQFDINYYHENYKDIQVSESVPNPNGGGVISVVANAAKAKLDGGEFDLRGLPLPGLELDLNGALAASQYSKYLYDGVLNAAGFPLVLTPRWQFGAEAAYTYHTPIGSLRTQVDYNWTDTMLADFIAYTRAHGILDARISLDMKQGWNVALYGKNLTNERYLLFPIDVIAAFGTLINGHYNLPTMFGVELTKRF